MGDSSSVTKTGAGAARPGMVAENSRTIFRYKTRKGLLHRIPAAVKILSLLPLSVVCMSLPLPALAAGIVCAAGAAFVCGFSVREQFTDLKPAAFYAALMYALSVFSILLEKREPMPLSALAVLACVPRPGFVFTVLRLTLIIQLSALLFRTTTTLEVRNAVRDVEIFIRRGLARVPLVKKLILPEPRFAESAALFASFIPEIFQTWNQIDMAWRARGGKPGMQKIKTLIFALLTLGFEKAAKKAKALAARGA